MEDRVGRYIEWYGWYGTVAVVLAYVLVSFSYLEATSFLYQFLNATGALGIVAVSFYKRAYQPGVLNMVWAVIAILAIGQILFR